MPEDGPPAGDGPTGVTTREEFGALLGQLRARSGRTLRDLARAIDGGASTIGDWCRGDRLPFPSQHGVFTRLLAQLGVDDPGPWLDAVVRLRDGTGRQRLRSDAAPYRGLKSFGREDAPWFFGRGELVERAVKRLRLVLDARDRARVLLVVGASGAGKSSLLHAGLCPALEAEGHPCLALTPGPEPFDRLVACLAGHLGVPAGEARDGLATDPAVWLATLPPVPEGPGAVLLVDQAEELFSECRDPDQRERFLAATAALTAPGAGARHAVVLGLRIDFYADLAATGHLEEPIQDAQVLVGPMDRAQLTAAITEPATRAGFSIDDALVDALLRDIVPAGSLTGRHDAGALPLLSHALLETWRRSGRGRMTVDDYRRAGGIGGAVEESAEHAYAQLSPAGAAAVRQVFLRLVHLDEDVVTRGVVSYGELHGLVPADPPGAGGGGHDGPDNDPRAEAMRVLGPFVEGRLVTARKDTVEIAHEALLAAWPRLRGWVEEDREALAFHRRIGDAARLWVDSERDASTLAGGVRLAAMEAWAGSEARTVRFTQDEEEYIAASREHASEQDRQRRRHARRLRTLASVATACALLAGVLAVVAERARSDALAARDEALSRQIAASAEKLRGRDPTLVAQLTVAGYRPKQTTEARSALLQTADVPHARRYLGGAGPTALAVSAEAGVVAVSDATDGSVQLFTQAGGGLRRAGVVEAEDPEQDVYALALTPDDRTLVVGDTAATITLWDVSDPRRPVRSATLPGGPEGPIQQLAVTADGGELAATGEGDGVFRWDISDADHPAPLPLVPWGPVTWGLAYHPDGGLLAYGQEQGAVELWDVRGEPRRVARLPMGERRAHTVAFSPDGDWLAAGSQSGDLRIWDVSTPASPAPVEFDDDEFEAWVNDAAFSPDGAYLVVGSSDGELRVFETEDWTTVRSLPHPAALTQAAFTGGGASLVTTAVDGTARVWDVDRTLPARLGGSVFALAFTPDGHRLAAFASTETEVWDVSDPATPTPVVSDVVSPDEDDPFSGSGDLSPDGTVLAQGTVGGNVYLADISDPSRPAVSEPLGGFEGLVEAAAFSADGDLLAAGSDDETVRVWDVADPARPRRAAVLDDPTEIVLNVTWSPSGHHLVANSADGYAYLYDVGDPARPELLARLGGFESESYATAFAPGGDVVAVGGTDAVVILWDVADPRHPRRIGEPVGGPASRIYDLAFSRDGDTLVAAVVDGTTWVWDTTDPAAPAPRAVLGPSDEPAYTVAVAPGGRLVAGSGADQELHLWSLDAEAVIDVVCDTTGEVITEEEWERYVPGLRYDPPC